jgi:hypothetical protein
LKKFIYNFAKRFYRLENNTKLYDLRGTWLLSSFNKDKTENDIVYMQAVLADLKNQRHWVQGREIQTIFIGGGTPSLCSIAAMEVLLAGMYSA